MIPFDPTSHIVVGTDLSHRADQAVTWAADRAAARAEPLIVVLVLADLPIPKKSHVFAAIRTGDYLADLRRRADQRVAEVRERILARHPQLEVSALVVEGVAAEVLAEASRTASLVVVGARGRSAPATVRALGGTADAVTAHSVGPVAVVTDLGQPTAEGPVVVGVDDSVEALAAVKLAIDEAARTSRRLIAVHAFDDLGALFTSGMGLWSVDVGEATSYFHTMVGDLIAPYLADHPEVKAEIRVEPGRAATALAEASVDASLLVVGSRGRGGFLGLLLGSTSKGVLREAECPVIVARPRHLR